MGKGLSARQIIFKEYGSSYNFMTPHVVGFRSIVPGRMAAEVSRGAGLFHDHLVGVSVVRVLDDGSTERDPDGLNCSFSARKLDAALAEAEAYVAKLQAEHGQ